MSSSWWKTPDINHCFRNYQQGCEMNINSTVISGYQTLNDMRYLLDGSADNRRHIMLTWLWRNAVHHTESGDLLPELSHQCQAAVSAVRRGCAVTGCAAGRRETAAPRSLAVDSDMLVVSSGTSATQSGNITGEIMPTLVCFSGIARIAFGCQCCAPGMRRHWMRCWQARNRSAAFARC
jgi:hypothetical protein